MNRVPMRWPDSPREHWNRPEALALLAGTPINCLVLPGETGSQDWRPLIARAGAIGITVLESRRPAEADGVVEIDKGVWPSIRRLGRGDGASAGPTGNAWVDSNGWRIRLARERAARRNVWLSYVPPAKVEVPAEAYVMAVADAAAYGGRWIISLGEALAIGLARGEEPSIKIWKRLTTATAFFEEHAGWDSFTPVANLGVLSDFTGSNEAFAGEVLNLAARRHQLYRILLMDKSGSGFGNGLSAVIYADRTPPPRAVGKWLADYVEGGGLLVGPPALQAIVPATARQREKYPRHHVLLFGKGRFAIAAKDSADPYLLVSDTQLILSRRHDLLRVWNGGSMNVHVTASPDGRQTLVQVLNYSLRAAGHEASFQLKDPYGAGRLKRIEAPAEPITPVNATMGTEVRLPGIPVYGAIELTK